MQIPERVLSGFYDSNGSDLDCTQISGGLLNSTFIVEGMGSKSILQRLNQIYSESVVEDYLVVSKHLKGLGWDIPAARKTREGAAALMDSDGRLWRSFEFIESDGHISSASGANIELASLLGRLHRDLAGLDYRPRFSIPNFHDTGHFIRELDLMSEKFGETEEATLAKALIDAFQAEEPDQDSEQLIHGDPKLANALFRDGKPFTLIDWDTLMLGSPFIDLGDMLRSVIKTEFSSSGTYNIKSVDAIIKGYLKSSGRDEEFEEFREKAIGSTRILSIELAARYLIDSIRCEIFDWDPNSFESQRAHNLERAKLQYGCYLLTV